MAITTANLENTWGIIQGIPPESSERVCTAIAKTMMEHPDGVTVVDESLLFDGQRLAFSDVTFLHRLGFTSYARDMCLGVRFKINQRGLDYLAQCQ